MFLKSNAHPFRRSLKPRFQRARARRKISRAKSFISRVVPTLYEGTLVAATGSTAAILQVGNAVFLPFKSIENIDFRSGKLPY